MASNTPLPTISLLLCPLCKGKIVYEKHRTGLVTMHELPGGGLDFLCPEPSVVVRKK